MADFITAATAARHAGLITDDESIWDMNVRRRAAPYPTTRVRPWLGRTFEPR